MIFITVAGWYPPVGIYPGYVEYVVLPLESQYFKIEIVKVCYYFYFFGN